MTFDLYLAPEAQADIDDVIEWSVEQFGGAVRDGYQELINAMIELLPHDAMNLPEQHIP